MGITPSLLAGPYVGFQQFINQDKLTENLLILFFK